jgi:hypothetical protein
MCAKYNKNSLVRKYTVLGPARYRGYINLSKTLTSFFLYLTTLTSLLKATYSSLIDVSLFSSLL